MNKPAPGTLRPVEALPWQEVSLDVLREKYAKGAERDLDGPDMARAVQKGELTPEHLLAAAMARCDAVNPKVNAVNMRHDEYAQALLKTRRAAGASTTGALAGVPILLKDLNTYLEGTRTTNGCRLFKDAPPAPHSLRHGRRWASE